MNKLDLLLKLEATPGMTFGHHQSKGKMVPMSTIIANAAIVETCIISNNPTTARDCFPFILEAYTNLDGSSLIDIFKEMTIKFHFPQDEVIQVFIDASNQLNPTEQVIEKVEEHVEKAVTERPFYQDFSNLYTFLVKKYTEEPERSRYQTPPEPYIYLQGTEHHLASPQLHFDNAFDEVRAFSLTMHPEYKHATDKRQVYINTLAFIHNSKYQRDIAEYLLPKPELDKLESLPCRHRGIMIQNVIHDTIFIDTSPEEAPIPKDQPTDDYKLAGAFYMLSKMKEMYELYPQMEKALPSIEIKQPKLISSDIVTQSYKTFSVFKDDGELISVFEMSYDLDTKIMNISEVNSGITLSAGLSSSLEADQIFEQFRFGVRFGAPYRLALEAIQKLGRKILTV